MKKIIKAIIYIIIVLALASVVTRAIIYRGYGIDIYGVAADFINNNTNIHINYNGFNGSSTSHSDNSDDKKTQKLTDVNEIVVNWGAGELYILDSEDEEYHVLTDTDLDYSYEVQNGVMKLKLKTKNIDLGGLKNTVKIFAPKGATVKKVDLDLGACAATINTEAKLEELKVDLGAGSLEVCNGEIGKSDIKVGMGEAVFTNTKTQKLDAEIGMGNLEYYGIVLGDLYVDCGMGNAKLSFEDSFDNHNFDLSMSMGNLEVDGIYLSGMSDKKKIDNGADSTYTMKCSMGNVEAFFE